MGGGSAAANRAQKRNVTRSVCPSEHHIARILHARHFREPLVFAHHLAGISAYCPGDAGALVAAHAPGSGVVGHQCLVPAWEPPLEPMEVAERESQADHRGRAYGTPAAETAM